MKMIDDKKQDLMESCSNYVLYLFLSAVKKPSILSPFLMEEFLGISELIDSGSTEIIPFIRPVIEEEMREGTYLLDGKEAYVTKLSNFFEEYYLEKGPFYRMILDVIEKI